MTEPQTDAGKQLITALRDHAPWFLGGSGPAEARYVLAIEAQSRNATLDEVVRAVEGLPVSNTYLRDPDSETGAIRAADALDRAAVLDAVKALRG